MPQEPPDPTDEEIEADEASRLSELRAEVRETLDHETRVLFDRASEAKRTCFALLLTEIESLHSTSAPGGRLRAKAVVLLDNEEDPEGELLKQALDHAMLFSDFMLTAPHHKSKGKLNLYRYHPAVAGKIRAARAARTAVSDNIYVKFEEIHDLCVREGIPKDHLKYQIKQRWQEREPDTKWKTIEGRVTRYWKKKYPKQAS